MSSLRPWSKTESGVGNRRDAWGANYGWCSFYDQHYLEGEKTHSRLLPGGTPWRNPTHFKREIWNISDMNNVIISYPSGNAAYLIFGGDADIALSLTCNGWWDGHQFPDFSALYNEASTKVLNKLANQKADLGSNIAEGRQAISMVAKASSQVFRALLAFKRGEFARVAEILEMKPRDILYGRFAANKWLEYIFGWKPLLSDIHDGYKNFHEIVRKDLIVSAKGTAKRQRDGSTATPNWQCSGGYTSTHGLSMRIDAHIDIPELRQANQWNLINPLSVAWEVMPWSFAIDWFVPVGNVLEACTARAGLGFVGGSFTTHRQSKEYTEYTNEPFGNTIVDTGRWELERLYVERNPIYDFPEPTFYAKQNPFSLTHVSEALALWRQMPALR